MDPGRTARVGGIAGTVLLAGVAIYHAVVFAIGGTAGGRMRKHVVDAGRIENLVALLVALGTAAVFLTLLITLTRPPRRPTKTVDRLGALYLAIALAMLLATGRLS